MMTKWISLRTVRVAWLALAIATTVAWFGGPISRWSDLQKICHPDSACQPVQLDASAAGTLSMHGISMIGFAAGVVAILAALWVFWFGVASLIMLRQTDDRGALLGAFFLVLLPLWELNTWVSWGWLNNLSFPIFGTALLLFTLVFPDGRFRPSWTRWLAIGLAMFVASVALIPFPTAAYGPIFVVFISMFVTVIGLQIYRFRVISSWDQQQQTKWAVFGLVMAIVGLVTTWLTQYVLPFPSGNGSLYLAVDNAVGIATVLSAIPLFIGVAVMRNRLWDIDHVVNRALVYTMLTVVLAGLYAGGILGLQWLFSLVLGGGSALAIAISTLAIAALFSPLRRRIQVGIDRRFYRRRYDAQRTLVAFAEQVRDEVDLTQLSRGLMTVVRETLQPEHISLWLRGGSNDSTSVGAASRGGVRDSIAPDKL
jgi:hypothetical protein